MSIKKKILIIVLLFSFFPPLVATTIGFLSSKKALEEKTLFNLFTISEFREGEILLYLEMLKNRTLDFSTEGICRDYLHQCNDFTAIQDAQEPLSQNLYQKALLDPNIDAIDILNSKGIIVASSDNSRLRKDVSDQEYFTKGLNEFYISDNDEEFDKPGHSHIITSHKIVDSENILLTTGVIVIHFDSNTLSELLSGRYVINLGAMTQIRGVGKTGETYLVNTKKTMITESLFVNNSINTLRVDTHPVNECLNNRKEVHGKWKNYRGINVVGSSMCIQYGNIKWVLVVEQNTEEAFSSVYKLGITLIIIGVIVQLLIFIFIIYFTIRLVKPIEKLTLASKEVSEGNHEKHLPETHRQDEIGTLARSLESMKSQIVSAYNEIKEHDERKSHFVHNVSHEFKNPLAIINMALEDIKAIKDKKQHDRMVDISLRNVRRLTRLVMDLLDISKIEAGKMSLSINRIDMIRLVNEIIEEHTEETIKRNLKLDFDCKNKPITMYGDIDKLRRAILNLINNAIKYSNENGSINITLNERENEISFQISNTGPYLSDEDIKKMFDKFERITEEKQEGTGLGLPIAKDIIILHKGNIGVTSTKEGIITFTVNLPKGKP